MGCVCTMKTVDPTCPMHGEGGTPGCTCATSYDPCPAHPSRRHAQLRKAATPAPSPLDVQVGGGHYKGMKIQPVEFITANNLGFLEGCIVKRISRWRTKDGIQDLEKIKHECDLLIELERRNQASEALPGGA